MTCEKGRLIQLVLCRLFLAEVLGVAPAAIADNDLLAGESIPQRAEGEHATTANVGVTF